MKLLSFLRHFPLLLLLPYILFFRSIFKENNIYEKVLVEEKKQNILFPKQNGHAFATIITPAFAMGAVTLGYSIKKYTGDQYDRICLVTQDVNDSWVEVLQQWWTVLRYPDYQPTPQSRRSWLKIRLWSLIQYSKIVYLDTDILPFANLSELFDYPQLSCVPDLNPPQVCNTGVLVIEPKPNLFEEFVKFASFSSNRFNIGDQGTINAFFGSFTPIPATYNLPRIPISGFKRLHTNFSHKTVHFVCKKPWKCGRSQVDTCGCGYPSYNKIWYQVWDEACLNHKCLESWWEPLTGQGF